MVITQLRSAKNFGLPKYLENIAHTPKNV